MKTNLFPVIRNCNNKPQIQWSQPFELSDKADIQSDKFKEYLKFLKSNKDFKHLICSCRSDNHVQLAVKTFSKKKKEHKRFLIAHFPKQARYHTHTCVLRENTKGYTLNKNQKVVTVSPYLLDKPRKTRISNSRMKPMKHSKKTIQTFNGFVEALLSEAYTHAFNVQNNGLKRLNSQNMSNVSITMLHNTFRHQLKKLQVGKGSLDEHQKRKGIQIKFGISNNDLPIIDEEETLQQIMLEEVTYDIESETLTDMKNSAKKIGGFSSPPFFYFLVIKNCEIVRGYLYRVAIKNSLIATVDSKLERKVITNLFTKGKVVFKPIRTHSIALALTNEEKLSKMFFKHNNNDYLPDVLIFENNRITVCEIDGKIDEDYEADLANKELRFYRHLDSKYFEYQRLDES